MTQTTANYYQLSDGSNLHVAFAPDGVPDRLTGFSTGQPVLRYQDERGTRDFVGDHIRIVPNDLGRLVSITLVQTIDSNNTTFSLLVPRVALIDGGQQPVATEGIRCLHRFSIPVVIGGVIQPWDIGQDDLYTVVDLAGYAHRITFRQPPN